MLVSLTVRGAGAPLPQPRVGGQLFLGSVLDGLMVEGAGTPGPVPCPLGCWLGFWGYELGVSVLWRGVLRVLGV